MIPNDGKWAVSPVFEIGKIRIQDTLKAMLLMQVSRSVDVEIVCGHLRENGHHSEPMNLISRPIDQNNTAGIVCLYSSKAIESL